MNQKDIKEINWVIEKLLSEETKIKLMNMLREKFDIGEERDNEVVHFFNVDLDNSYIVLIDYLRGITK